MTAKSYNAACPITPGVNCTHSGYHAECLDQKAVRRSERTFYEKTTRKVHSGYYNPLQVCLVFCVFVVAIVVSAMVGDICASVSVKEITCRGETVSSMFWFFRLILWIIIMMCNVLRYSAGVSIKESLECETPKLRGGLPPHNWGRVLNPFTTVYVYKAHMNFDVIYI